MSQTANTYRTIKKEGRGVFKDRGSKFIAYAYPVKSQQEIKQKLEELKKKHHNARHHCYAWRTGPGKEQSRQNDDGEPSGTAGRPIMGQIQSYDLTNILIVVVRYFGGTLLGSGGLINAYRGAAAEAIENGGPVKREVSCTYEIEFSYAVMNDVMTVIKDEKVRRVQEDFTRHCRFIVALPRERAERFAGRLEKIPEVYTIKHIETG